VFCLEPATHKTISQIVKVVKAVEVKSFFNMCSVYILIVSTMKVAAREHPGKNVLFE